MDNSQKATIVREWIIFAVSFGLGGHVALGLVLHAPEAWSWNKAGVHGLLIGLSVYVMVQVLRSCWWALKGNRRSQKACLPGDNDPFG